MARERPDADSDVEGVPKPSTPLPPGSKALLCDEHRQYLPNKARDARERPSSRGEDL